jgi:recombination protein RecT
MVVATIGSKDFRAKLDTALPKGVDADRFTRMTITALQANPDLLEADKDSLYLAILQCAQTGLPPDGKQAALVVFNTNVGNKQNARWIKKVQFMPMVTGIINKLGEIGIKCDTAVVHANDAFEWEQGDEPKIRHKPAQLGSDRGEMIGAYAILRPKGGDVYHEVMDASQIEAVRAQSRAPNSLMWSQFKSEGWRKTVLRRCAKRVPMPFDEALEKTLEADNATFEMGEPAKTGAEPAKDPTIVAEQSQPPQALEQTPGETLEMRVEQPAEAQVQSEESEDPAPPSERKQAPPARPRALSAVVATQSGSEDIF